MITTLFAPVAAAQDDQPEQPADDEQTYRIVQGDQEFEVEPIKGAVPVEEFYDYRYPYQSRESDSWGRSFSSHGTTDYQRDDTSVLMLYEGPNGVSLVAVHDKYH
ncbi:MAG: cell surface glycoprotein related protein, partial [Halohasta sp.]